MVIPLIVVLLVEVYTTSSLLINYSRRTTTILDGTLSIVALSKGPRRSQC